MTKIEALEKTIYNVENNVFSYGWSSANACNCGVLARTLLNGESPTAHGYADIPEPDSGDGFFLFSNKAKCLATGIELPKVFQSLKDAGFNHEELRHLEFLSMPEILQRVEFDIPNNGRYYTMKRNLLLYLREWVKILKEEQQPQHSDITKTLAVLPVEEVPDTLKTKEYASTN